MLGLIVAYEKNRVIGKNGKIPWHIPEDQKRFKELTIGNTVIMGRRTYEEIGHPLPDRNTIVVSSTRTYEGDCCRTARSLEQAIGMAGTERIFIAGGERLYREALPMVDVMYITEIEMDVEGDAFFPRFDGNQFEIIEECRIDGKIPYTYITYLRRAQAAE